MTESEAPAKPRVEVVEETAEVLDVLDLDRTPRAEKMAREARFLEGADDVSYAEREFLPRRAATLAEIRAFVDAHEPRRTEFPEPRAPPTALPPAEPQARAPPVPEHVRAALDATSHGRVVAAEIVHHEGAGEVVDATFETEDGARKKGLFVITDGVARPFDDIAARIDSLPAPAVPAPAAPAQVRATETTVLPEPPRAADEPSMPAPAEAKKGLLGRFSRSKKESPAPSVAPPTDAPAGETPEKKRRFGFGKK
jgi:hypothetical protein